MMVIVNCTWMIFKFVAKIMALSASVFLLQDSFCCNDKVCDIGNVRN